MVGAADQRAVVLDHQHRVPPRRQVAQQGEEPFAVLRVEADRRLVEHVEGAGEARAQGGGEMDALRLAPREGARLAVEGQVVEPHPVEDLDPLGQLVEQVAGDLALAGRPPALAQPGAELLDADRRELRQRPPLQVDGERPPAASGSPGTADRGCRSGSGRAARARAPCRCAPRGRRRNRRGSAGLPVPLQIHSRSRLGEVRPGHVERDLPLAAGGEELVVELLVGRGVPRRDRALGEGAAGVRDHPLAVDADHPAEPLALRAGAERRVEREQGRRRPPRRLAADRAGELAAVEAHVRRGRGPPPGRRSSGRPVSSGVEDARLGRRPRREAAEDERQGIALRRPLLARLHAQPPPRLPSSSRRRWNPWRISSAEGVVRPLLRPRQAHDQGEGSRRPRRRRGPPPPPRGSSCGPGRGR